MSVDANIIDKFQIIETQNKMQEIAWLSTLCYYVKEYKDDILNARISFYNMKKIMSVSQYELDPEMFENYNDVKWYHTCYDNETKHEKYDMYEKRFFDAITETFGCIYNRANPERDREEMMKAYNEYFERFHKAYVQSGNEIVEPVFKPFSARRCAVLYALNRFRKLECIECNVAKKSYEDVNYFCNQFSHSGEFKGYLKEARKIQNAIDNITDEVKLMAYENYKRRTTGQFVSPKIEKLAESVLFKMIDEDRNTNLNVL